jgi:hypothetical protein
MLQEVANAKGHRSSQNKPIPPLEPSRRQHPNSTDRDIREEEGRDTTKNRVGNGKEDTSDLPNDTEQDEEEATPTTGTTIGTAGNGDDTVVLSEGGEGGDGEEG